MPRTKKIKFGNRFSEQLLTMPIDPFSGFYWVELDKISSDLYMAAKDAVYGFSSKEMTADKHNIICLLAALSDEDLMECFGF